jgi:hypothetical protein
MLFPLKKVRSSVLGALSLKHGYGLAGMTGRLISGK